MFKIIAVYGVLASLALFVILLFQLSSFEECLFRIINIGSIVTLAVCSAKLLKYIFKKHRPKHMASVPEDSYAFPSAHASGLMALTFTTYQVSQQFFAYILIVSLLIMYARVRSRVHDVYDMIGGTVVAFVVTISLKEQVSYFSSYIIDFIL
ncbi:MAG: superfamily [Candidatus Parcubacteria bacterium]